MSKKVLNVGQCGFDNHSIAAFLGRHFDVEIRNTNLAADTLAALGQESFDLVLINRKLDQDYSDGIDVLRSIRADESFGDVPVMLVSNYADAQAAAVEAGAIQGFGKNECDQPAIVDRLAQVLC